MYVTAEIIREVEQRYGSPVEIAREYEMTPEQLDIVRLGQKHGRCHDVTLVIVDDERNIVVIRKPNYPPGAYRTPSGGIEPGESFDAGAKREAKEETGLDIELERYLIRAKVRFRRLGFHPDQSVLGDERGRDGVPTYENAIDWTTHVLQARPTGGTLQPLDTKEIVEARKASFGQITGKIKDALLASGSPGLRYRAELDGLALNLMRRRRPLFFVRTREVFGVLVLSLMYFLFLIPNGVRREAGITDLWMIGLWFGVFIVPLLLWSASELICRQMDRRKRQREQSSIS